MIDYCFFALNIFFGDFGMEVEKFQERFCFAVLVVAFVEFGKNFFSFGGVAESKAYLCPQKLELFVVRGFGKSFVQSG